MGTRDSPPTIRPLRGTTEENLLFVGPVLVDEGPNLTAIDADTSFLPVFAVVSVE